MPPNAYNVAADAFYAASLGGQGLTYDTAHLIPLADLIGIAEHHDANAEVLHVSKDAQLQRLVRATHPLESGDRGGVCRHDRTRLVS